MHESYRRLEDAHNYGFKLERDIVEAVNALEQSRFALIQSQEALSSCCTMLDEERLEFRGAQEALNFERERHKETIELLERVFEEARQSGELADMRSRQVAMLQSVPVSQSEHATAVVEEQWVGSLLTKENLAQLQSWDDQNAIKGTLSTECIPGDFHGQQSDPLPEVDKIEPEMPTSPKRPRPKRSANNKTRAPKKATQKRCGQVVAKDLLLSTARGEVVAGGSMSGQVETIATV